MHASHPSQSSATTSEPFLALFDRCGRRQRKGKANLDSDSHSSKTSSYLHHQLAPLILVAQSGTHSLRSNLARSFHHLIKVLDIHGFLFSLHNRTCCRSPCLGRFRTAVIKPSTISWVACAPPKPRIKHEYKSQSSWDSKSKSRWALPVSLVCPDSSNSLTALICSAVVGAFCHRTYLPDEEIRVSGFLCRGQETTWHIRLNESLCRVSGTQLPNGMMCNHINLSHFGDEKRLRCSLNHMVVDVMANKVIGSSLKASRLMPCLAAR